jgi:hypothetical protein
MDTQKEEKNGFTNTEIITFSAGVIILLLVLLFVGVKMSGF